VPAGFAESDAEEAALRWLESLGYMTTETISTISFSAPCPLPRFEAPGTGAGREPLRSRSTRSLLFSP